MRSTTTRPTTRVAAGVATASATFLRFLGVHPEAVPEERESRAGLFRSLLDGRRVLVVVDNLATAGAATGDGAEDVTDLLPTTAGSMAITTSRSALPRLGATHYVPLRSLGPDDTMALLTAIVGAERVAAEPEGAREVARRTGGMPLAVRIVGGRALHRPDLSLEDVAQRLDRLGFAGDVPDDMDVLRAGLDRVFDGLPEGARRAVVAVAHLPVDTFSGWVAGAVLGDRRAGDAALDVLHEASLVDPVVREGRETQYRLHDLVRVVRAGTGGSARGEPVSTCRGLVAPSWSRWPRGGSPATDRRCRSCRPASSRRAAPGRRRWLAVADDSRGSGERVGGFGGRCRVVRVTRWTPWARVGGGRRGGCCEPTPRCCWPARRPWPARARTCVAARGGLRPRARRPVGPAAVARRRAGRVGCRDLAPTTTAGSARPT